jgi:hypothetical protein
VRQQWRYKSFKICFDFSACQRRLVDFFHSSQIEARCHFFDMTQWLNFQSDSSCECCNLKGIRANNSSVIMGKN